ncbi:uncharacterized protein ACLA_031280 [Aspergillus clavatus NRRL 1]|uniref:Uncharacterized protein n=1 Tax=Aspergillus clavatus (strain ATCC 1007 / CBS 513.65 / DSM 816 / NCTC 3887 / NRRL 1 / QM 1276 / 107) TaxID=344612 RepID=A1CRX4_ASPCL|nr:uncharacterized protein ACLA_031280 [Aspergillus clavatus NRRL 1]EAW08395.1 conserved hypothetical protein [Aspergillus clavatus NRRL 1]
MTSTTQLASVLVARFLRSNNYTETLEVFIREAGLPANAGQSGANDDEKNKWTIEGVLEEKKAFDESVGFERYGANEEKDVWTVPAPSTPNIIPTPTSTNLLACSVEPWHIPSQEGNQGDTVPYLVATGADRQVHLFQTDDGNDVASSLTDLFDSPILSYAPIQNGEYVLLTNMSGQLLLQRGGKIISRRKDHAKYAVKVVACEEDDQPGESGARGIWAATAGWDSKVFLYRLRIPSSTADSDTLEINEPVAHITLPTNPESILFVRHPDTQELILLVSRRDSTYLFYYQVPPPTSTGVFGECQLLGKQNLAPHSIAWVAFSPACLALNPHDPGLLAVATSTLPHMKVIIVRLLFPKSDSPATGETSAEPETQATQALAALTLQNREDAAIMIQANTFAPQTAYSTPQVVWRPDGSGVWVNGDDGVIRGIETKTGKIATMLKDGHQAGSKVRTIWAGWVEVRRGDVVVKEEWLVSGGFDKKLIVWKV